MFYEQRGNFRISYDLDVSVSFDEDYDLYLFHSGQQDKAEPEAVFGEHISIVDLLLDVFDKVDLQPLHGFVDLQVEESEELPVITTQNSLKFE